MRPSGFISTWDGVELWRAGAHDVPPDAVPCTLPAENTLAAWDMFRAELRANCKRLVATLDDRQGGAHVLRLDLAVLLQYLPQPVMRQII